MSNKRSITCEKEKNVMEHEKNSREVVFSENLQRDVAVSLEEMVVTIANFFEEILSAASTECTDPTLWCRRALLVSWIQETRSQDF